MKGLLLMPPPFVRLALPKIEPLGGFPPKAFDVLLFREANGEEVCGCWKDWFVVPVGAPKTGV